MELPEGVVVTSSRHDGKGSLVVDLDIDICGLVEGLRKAMEQVGRAAQKAGKVFKQFASILRRAANDEVRVSGLEARFYVRGGLACRTEDDLSTLVQTLLTRPSTAVPEDDEDAFALALLHKENRVRLAVSAMRGYVTHIDREPVGNTLPWHRYMAGTSIVVRMDR